MVNPEDYFDDFLDDEYLECDDDEYERIRSDLMSDEDFILYGYEDSDE